MKRSTWTRGVDDPADAEILADLEKAVYRALEAGWTATRLERELDRILDDAEDEGLAR